MSAIRGVRGFPNAPRRKKRVVMTNCILLEDWMFELSLDNSRKLTDTELHVYAVLYQFSKHSAGAFCGSRQYLAERLRVSLTSINNAFTHLSQGGLIKEIEPHNWMAVEMVGDCCG